MLAALPFPERAIDRRPSDLSGLIRARGARGRIAHSAPGTHLLMRGLRRPMTQKVLKILLADDVRLELEIEKTFFQRSGFYVITASDGVAAFAIAASDLPDLVILDQVMPGMTGSDVCRNLKARPETRHIPVIITSGTESAELPALCAAAGAEAFIPKSAGREALLAAAARILRVPERKTARLTVCFTAQGIVGGKETLGKGVDLSEGGIRIEAPRAYSVGDIFSLRFLLPGDRQETRANGCVAAVGQKPGGVFVLTVRFTEMLESDRRRLNQHLDRAFAVR